MESALVETTLGVLRLTILFTTALFLPLFLQLLLLFLAGRAFKRVVSYTSTLIASWFHVIGVPVHEFSHAVAVVITFAKLHVVKPLIDETGGAFVLWESPRVLNVLPRAAVSVAPLFGGVVVLYLTASQIIPGFEVATVAPPVLNPQGAGSFKAMVTESLRYLWDYFRTLYGNLPDLQWKNWRTWIGLYVAMSVSMSIAPSPPDVKIFLGSLPALFVLSLPVFAWLYLSGKAEAWFLAAQQVLLPPLFQFSTVVTYAFLLTTLGLAIFLIPYLWKKLRGK